MNARWRRCWRPGCSWGWRSETAFVELANARRILLAATTPAFIAHEGTRAHLEASLSVLENGLALWSSERTIDRRCRGGSCCSRADGALSSSIQAVHLRRLHPETPMAKKPNNDQDRLGQVEQTDLSTKAASTRNSSTGSRNGATGSFWPCFWWPLPASAGSGWNAARMNVGMPRGTGSPPPSCQARSKRSPWRPKASTPCRSSP